MPELAFHCAGIGYALFQIEISSVLDMSQNLVVYSLTDISFNICMV